MAKKSLVIMGRISLSDRTCWSRETSGCRQKRKAGRVEKPLRFSLSCVAAEMLSVLGLAEDRPVEQAQDGGAPSAGGTPDRSGITEVTV